MQIKYKSFMSIILLVKIKGTAISTIYNISSIFYLASSASFSIKLKIIASFFKRY